jgi:hypothetical protein
VRQKIPEFPAAVAPQDSLDDLAGGPIACHTERMIPRMTRSLLGLGTVCVLLGAAAPTGAPARGAELYAPETLDQYFKLEWSRAGKNLNGYVYNTSNRRAAQMILLVEGLDGAGKLVTKTTTWVRDVPPNNRAYFQVAVPTAAAYRVRVQSFNWVEDSLDRRKAW